MTHENSDYLIERWASVSGFLLQREPRSPNRYYFYVSSNVETFQIVLEQPLNNSIRIDAHLIESPTDKEAHFIWEIPASEIVEGLDLSILSVKKWFGRNTSSVG